MKHSTNEKKLNSVKRLTFISAIASLMILTFLPLLFISSKHEFIGNYGSFLSGAVGTAISMVTIYFVYQTFKLQKKQLKSQKKELTETRNQLKRQQFETVFFNMLNMINTIGSEIEYTEIHPILFSVENREELHKGNGFFKYFMNQMTKVKWKDRIIHDDRLCKFVINKLAENPYEVVTSDYLKSEDVSKSITNAHVVANWIEKDKEAHELIFYGLVYEFYFYEYDAQLGHFFRYIHNTIKFVIKERAAIGDDREYINLIQAQLSNYQLTVLFYNCLSKISLNSKREANTKELLDKYELFQNIPQSLLVDPSHQRFYPNTNFKDKYEA